MIGLVVGLCALSAQPAEQPVVYRGARILTAVGAPIESGILITHHGKIVAVGEQKGIAIPENAVVRDMGGKTIIPGLVDTHSHIGIYPRPSVPAHSDGNEMSGPVQSGIRAIDAIYPDDPGIRMAQAGGVTTANIMPGSGNVIGGQTLYVKLRGRTVEDMRLTHSAVLGGLKMANGENPKGYGRRGNQAPGTRMKVASLQREQFLKAREYKQKWAAYREAVAAGKELPRPDTDLGLETLVEVLDRKRTVHFHCHRADDIMTALRLSEEFGFEIVLQHATEAYRVAEELAKRKAPVSLTLVDSPGGKLETAALIDENAALLEKAGVLVAINTDDWITESRFYLRTGAIAVRGGMSEEAALKALTINPAKMMHLEERVGSLEKGKDADFVILSGPPFSVYGQVLETYIDGACVFDRSKPKDRGYQTGGFALADQGRLPKVPAATVPLDGRSAKVDLPKPSDAAPRQPGPLVILAGRIHPVAAAPIIDGAILVEDGQIRYVGPRRGLQMPERAAVLTAREVTPGLIDAHTVVGVSGKFNVAADQDQDEASDPNQADLRVLDAFNPNEPLLQLFRENGVTIVHAMPGRTNVIAGQTGIFRTHGRTAEQMALRFPAGLLVNLGESPKQTYPAKVTTRMGTAGLVRNAFSEAQNYAKKRQTKDEEKKPARSLKLEALDPVLAGKLPVIFSAHRADDIGTALRIAKEFQLKAVLGLATEGYLMADRIASAGVPVFVHPAMQRIASMETFHSHLSNAAVLAEHKVPIALGTGFEGYVPKTRVLRYEAAMAMVNGLGHERTLRAITLDAARLLGLDERYGSIEVGKAADLVLYDGDPFEHATHVTHTVMDGRIIYDRAEQLKVPFARRMLPLLIEGSGCCMGAW
jgi:imidazolonepropionase-like amidohydrolase